MSHVDDIASVAEQEVVRRRDALVSRRTEMLEKRAEVIAELRGIDRDLDDCKATARFFGLNLTFPPDEREEYERIRAIRREQELRERELARMRLLREQASQQEMPLASPPKPQQNTDVEASAPTKQTKRPPVRVVALQQLKDAGSSGLKAGAIRDYLEREYSLIVHEKTVGMTLYRLSQANLVHRDGHMWFFGPSNTTETKNPGGDPPGLVELM